MTDVNSTLQERGARYGSFDEHAKISQGLLDVVRKLPAWNDKLEPDMKQAISTIFDKIARIMNGDPFYTDNWHDIQGYARLVEARILKLEAEAEEAKKQKLFEEEKKNLTDLLKGGLATTRQVRHEDSVFIPGYL